MHTRPSTLFFTLAASGLLAGCSGTSSPEATPAPQAAASTHVTTPWDSLLKDRDKAKAVQQTVNAHAKRQKKAIEQQTQ